MFEVLILIILFGLSLSIKKDRSFANPFVIYFAIWLMVFLSIYVDSNNYIGFDDQLLIVLILAKFLSLTILSSLFVFSSAPGQGVDKKQLFLLVNQRLLNWALVIGLVTLPLAYLKAVEISGGGDLFSVLGYISLRHAITEDNLGYGVYGNIFIMIYVATAIRFYLYLESRSNLMLLVLGFLLVLAFLYLSTGRTSVLLFFALIVIPGVLQGKFRVRMILVFVLILAGLFMTIATLTAKGVSLESDLQENLASTLESLRSYIAAPILAFNVLYRHIEIFEYGVNSFRAFISLLNHIGFSDLEPVKLIKDFVDVPWPTNVYTVYEVYYRDFSLVGVFIPSLFLIVHFWLYIRAKIFQGKWLFIYAASVYPLIMQFFQDQYFSLSSMHVQIIFWCILFFKQKKLKYD